MALTQGAAQRLWDSTLNPLTKWDRIWWALIPTLHSLISPVTGWESGPILCLLATLATATLCSTSLTPIFTAVSAQTILCIPGKEQRFKWRVLRHQGRAIYEKDWSVEMMISISLLSLGPTLHPTFWQQQSCYPLYLLKSQTSTFSSSTLKIRGH